MFRQLETIERPKPRDFFVNAVQDSCTTNVLDEFLDTIDEATEHQSLHPTIIPVVRRLLHLCKETPGKERKADVSTVIFQFILQYPGVFDWTVLHSGFLQAVANKLIDFAVERNNGVVVKGGRPFLEDETRDMANRLRNLGDVEKAAVLEALL